jgi:hypothetical protein
MTALFQVYVEGTRDPSPAAVAKLAAGIGQKYGLPPADIEARLQRGRFRVKANADRATAAQYVRELEALGAVCTVVDTSGATVDVVAMPAPSARSLPKPSGPPRAAAPPLPPATSAPRPASSPLPPAAPRAASAPTGLAAAAAAGASADLGVLGRDDGAIALASLDGADEPVIERTAHAERSFAPPGGKPASKPPAAASAPPAPAAAAKPATAPREIDADAFAAPDDEAEMELALDVVAERQKRAPTPVPVPVTPAATAPGRRDSKPALGGGPAAATAAPRAAMPPVGDVVRARLADVRIRFAAGVLAAVLIGFLPACIVGTIKQNAAFAEVDQKLDAQQRAVTSLDEYETLDRTRALALERKHSERTNAAITAFLIWAVAGAAVAYVWFRRVPWDRLTARAAAG